ncbi:globin domain-containing protein [Shewanella spartinae]|uniref:globin domain-containing protein n=1 Tax=Shewanella spartinae TaxID=2864205 RepID=UPI001C6573D5|nr:globin domain-containing protein [Shewanella spartinae]QYJ95450.1 hypothetical protein K0I31_08865 [Shewanella spartinae]
MPLTDEQKQLIQKSFAEINRQNSNFASHFYDCLFAMAPLIRPMFQSERPVFEYHFNELITTAVAKVHQFNEVKPKLEELGRKHLDYGVNVSQFEVVRAALLLSIQDCLRDASSPAIEQAWSCYYDEIAKVMIAAMQEAAS